MNRRDFFKGLAAACVAASAGIQLLPEQQKLIAQYRRQYSLDSDDWMHRYDVKHDGNIHCVDCRSPNKELTEKEVQFMLAAFEHAFGLQAVSA